MLHGSFEFAKEAIQSAERGTELASLAKVGHDLIDIAAPNVGQDHIAAVKIAHAADGVPAIGVERIAILHVSRRDIRRRRGVRQQFRVVAIGPLPPVLGHARSQSRRDLGL